MFDPVGSFAKQFVPVEDGYLYYPSRKSGGKLVTLAEYEKLVADWQRTAGPKGRWKIVGVVFLAIACWMTISSMLDLPKWTEDIIVYVSVAGISGWLLWASCAPRRLVKDREDIVPPGQPTESRRHARALLNWPFVIFGIILTGIVFCGSVNNPNPTIIQWLWIVGSGAMFGLYLWIALQKFRDGNAE